MRRSFVGTVLAVSVAGLVAVPGAHAAIFFTGAPGTGAPPSTLGAYWMTPFNADPRPLDQTVTSVPSPLGGSLTFSQPVIHVRPGNVEWATWSNGYTGDVYWPYPSDSVTLTLPPATGAFYLYAEPWPLGQIVDITATSQNGTTSGPVPVQGTAGATYYGFYATGADHIATITLTSSQMFGVGEFGIALWNPLSALL